MAGRGNDMSEGGVLVFAGMELKTGEPGLIEFTPPFAAGPVHARGIVRHRRGYNYGIEFAHDTKEDQEQTEKFRGLLPWPQATPQSKWRQTKISHLLSSHFRQSAGRCIYPQIPLIYRGGLVL